VAVWKSIRESDGVLRRRDVAETRPSPGSLSWHMTGDSSGKRHRVVVMVAPHDAGLVQSIEIKAADDPAAAPPPSTDLS
jgi:hypothetical protein